MVTSRPGAWTTAQEALAPSTAGEVRAASRRLPAAQHRTRGANRPMIVFMLDPPEIVRLDVNVESTKGRSGNPPLPFKGSSGLLNLRVPSAETSAGSAAGGGG